MPYVGQKPADIISTAVDTVTGKFSGEVDAASLDISGNIDVDGTTNLDVVDIDGVLTQDGGAVFNEASADVDFRVESNNDANAFFVEGSTGNIGIGTNGPAGDFHLTDASDIRILFTSDQTGNTSSDGSFIGLTDGGVFNIFNRENTSTKFTNNGVTSMNISGAGIITKPLQPAFLVQPATRQSNVADGTQFVFGTEIFDNNADFGSNVFTAPVTGRYQLQVALRIDNVDTAANFCRVVLQTSNRNYVGAMIDPAVLSADPGEWNFNFSVLADMDANDGVGVFWSQSAGADQADIETDCFFSGYLVC